jgi:hypothetical protein
MTSFGKAKARRKQAGAETGRMVVNRSFFLMRTNGPIVTSDGFFLATAKPMPAV